MTSQKQHEIDGDISEKLQQYFILHISPHRESYITPPHHQLKFLIRPRLFFGHRVGHPATNVSSSESPRPCVRNTKDDMNIEYIGEATTD